ncbi:hypothetical protein QTV49_003888 [Vibrio vulnificus]|nr:hypothetical protein [Vibrio vulnificus]
MNNSVTSLSPSELVDYNRHSQNITRLATLFNDSDKAKKYLRDQGIEAETLTQEEIIRQILKKNLLNTELPQGYLSVSEELAAKQLSKRAVDASQMDLPEFKQSKLSSQISFMDDVKSGRGLVNLSDSLSDVNFGKTFGFIAKHSIGFGLAAFTGGASIALVSNPLISYSIYCLVKSSVFKALEFSGVLTSLKKAFSSFLTKISKAVGFDKLSEKHPSLSKGAKLIAVGVAVTAAIIALDSHASPEGLLSNEPASRSSLQALGAFEEGVEQSLNDPVKDQLEAIKHLAGFSEDLSVTEKVLASESVDRFTDILPDMDDQSSVASKPKEFDIPKYLTGDFSGSEKSYDMTEVLDSIGEETYAGQILSSVDGDVPLAPDVSDNLDIAQLTKQLELIMQLAHYSDDPDIALAVFELEEKLNLLKELSGESDVPDLTGKSFASESVDRFTDILPDMNDQESVVNKPEEFDIPKYLNRDFSGLGNSYDTTEVLDSIGKESNVGQVFELESVDRFTDILPDMNNQVSQGDNLKEIGVYGEVAVEASQSGSVQLEIKSGSSIWKTYATYLEDTGVVFENEAQKNEVMVNVIQEIARMNPDLSSVHKIEAGRVLNFPSIETLDQALSLAESIDVTIDNNVLASHEHYEGATESSKSIINENSYEVTSTQEVVNLNNPQLSGESFGVKVDWKIIDNEGYTGYTGDSGGFLMFEDSPQEKIRTVAESISNKLHNSDDYSLIEKEFVTKQIEAEILNQNTLSITDKGLLRVPTNFDDMLFAEIASGVNDQYIGEYVAENAKTYTESDYQMDSKGVVHMTSEKSIEQVSATIALEMSKREDMTADQIGKLYGEIVESIKSENGIRGNDVPLDKFKIPNELQVEIKNERLLKCTDLYTPHERIKF